MGERPTPADAKLSADRQIKRERRMFTSHLAQAAPTILSEESGFAHIIDSLNPQVRQAFIDASIELATVNKCGRTSDELFKEVKRHGRTQIVDPVIDRVAGKFRRAGVPIQEIQGYIEMIKTSSDALITAVYQDPTL